MTVALAGRAPATFEIKSANLPLVALLLKSADLRGLAGELQARYGELPEFFDHDPLVIDLAPLPGDAEVDFAGLVRLLRNHRVIPVAVRGGSPAQQAAAREAGLALAEEAQPLRPTPVPVREQQPAEAPASAPLGALLIDKPLRSGQQVYARGGDLIVLAVVSFGAEVIADGSIHVYAPLRGRAIAGARGDSGARIFSTCMEPQLVSIAGTYRTTETALPADVQGKPAQVRLAGEKLAIDALKL